REAGDTGVAVVLFNARKVDLGSDGADLSRRSALRRRRILEAYGNGFVLVRGDETLRPRADNAHRLLPFPLDGDHAGHALPQRLRPILHRERIVRFLFLGVVAALIADVARGG